MKKKKIIISSIIILVFIALCIYKIVKINPHRIVIREETIESNKLSNSSKDLYIAYFSDLHYANFTYNDELDKTVEIINSLKPDIVLFGGDLIDELNTRGISESDRSYLISKLNELTPCLGKFAVLGDHDGSGINEILNETNFEILDNINHILYYDDNAYINLVGIEPLYYGTPDISKSFDGLSSEAYTIVLTHCPDIFDDLPTYMCDLVLAGHSHGPQIYVPLINHFYRINGSNIYARGKHNKDGAMLDITNGVGLTKNSIRFLSDAEVVFYKLSSIN